MLKVLGMGLGPRETRGYKKGFPGLAVLTAH
jgi:hypothetical protein